MPLVDLSSSDATQNRKTNPFNHLGDRTQPNRVEPIALPNFSIPFKLDAGEKVLTVGSCFARNIEKHLVRRGFNLPTLELFDKEEFANLNVNVVNNYGTPSIYNEFAWALGEEKFVSDEHILEIQPGKFIDLHIRAGIRPEPREAVEKRRELIMETYRTALDCRLVILTLGLAEVWYDSKTGYYVNTAPMSRLMREDPDRFRLHVLSYEETQDFLDKTMQLLQRKGRDDLQVILTVSPVPLIATHRAEDVMIANTYSKSVLRSVAESITQSYDFVSYYPSYESVTYSDRMVAWRDDFIHVTPEIVAVNVGRMIDACVATPQSHDDIREEIGNGGIGIAIAKAYAIRQGDPQEAAGFFQAFADLSSRSLDFATEEALFHESREDYQSAINCLSRAPGELGDGQSIRVAAISLQNLGRFEEAYDLLDKAVERHKMLGTLRGVPLWEMLFNAASGTDDAEKVLKTTERWCAAFPGHACRANALASRWFNERGDYEQALEFSRASYDLDAKNTIAALYHAENLLALKRRDEAEALLKDVSPSNQHERTEHARIFQALNAANE